MLAQKLNNFKYIMSTIKSSFFPAMLLLCSITIFYTWHPFQNESALILHNILLITSGFSLFFLYFTKQLKSFFILLIGIVSYLIINNLKYRYNSEFISSNQFQCLCLALPLTLLILYFLPFNKIKTTSYILILLLMETVILQKYCYLISAFPYINITLEAIPLIAFALWIIALVLLVIYICFNSSIINTGILYSSISLFLGLIYSDESSGRTAFFLGFCTILLLSAIFDLYHRYHYDYLENVGSKTSYLNHANSKFPFKYTIALFSIDNRDKLINVIGHNKLQSLEQMIINKIYELPYELTIYRYNESELIMVFKNEDAKHTFEFAENIRRTIAASEFVFTSKKSLKVTISICISEKTRKDLNATEVTERTHNALHKNYRFNCNITTII